jgi:hypothetical protein
MLQRIPRCKLHLVSHPRNPAYSLAQISNLLRGEEFKIKNVTDIQRFTYVHDLSAMHLPEQKQSFCWYDTVGQTKDHLW